MYNLKKQFDLDFDDYIVFVENNIPKSLFISDLNNKKLFISVNNAFKLVDILTEFNFIDKKENYYNLLVEYKMYFARILSTINLNDKYLIDNIMRLLTEKLYRILVGIYNPKRGEKRIRSTDRVSMKNDLTNNISNKNTYKLDTLYGDLSTEIHHTIGNECDFYNIRKLFSTKTDIIESTLEVTKNLTDVFIEEVFLKVVFAHKKDITTSFLTNIDNNLSSDIVSIVRNGVSI